jgi:hypothetical protein
VVAGVKENLTVVLEDSLGNIVTTDSHSKLTLQIQSGPAGGALVGKTTGTVTSGIAKFTNLSFPIAGTYTVKATDGLLKATDGLLNASSNSFTVTPAAATKLVFLQQPTATTHGMAIAPAIKIEVEDQFGNVVTTDSSTVTLSIKSGPKSATLGGIESIAAIDGVATLEDVLLPIAGTYTLDAFDGHLTSVVSESFLVS